MNEPRHGNGNDSGGGRGPFRGRRRRRGGRGGDRGGDMQRSGEPGEPQREGDDQWSDQDQGSDEGQPAAPAPVADAPEPSLTVPPDKTVVIGITGEPGAGKSALSRELSRLGAKIIHVDELGHEVIETAMVKRKLVKEFGDEIVSDDGAIDRRKLAAKAFASAETTAALNAAVHPKLGLLVRKHVKDAGNFVVIDAGLLHELGLGDLCNQAIYVRAPRDHRIARVAERGWDEAELARRETALGDADARRRACQLTVDNSGDAALLGAYAKTILARQLGIDLAALRRPAPAPQARRNEAETFDTEEIESPPGGAPGAQPIHPAQQFQQGQHPQGQRPPQPPRLGADGRPLPPHPGQPQQPRFEERPPVKVDLDTYLKRTLPDLQAESEKLNIQDLKWLKKHDLICEMLKRQASGRLDEIVIEGWIEMVKDQHAYVRSAINNYITVNTDTFITGQQLRRFGLQAGMHLTGTARAPRGQEKCPQLLSVQTVMGEPENQRTPCQDFYSLTPLHASERLFMELPNDPTDYTLRIFDLVAPIGKGQRGLIVAQPKCGKTVYLQKIAKAIALNNPEVILMVLLVDERPEEVTDMQRSVKGEVIASTFDQHGSRHVQAAEMTINKAKRLVERGKDVVILLDSLTRLARAYNTEAPSSGRILSGGLEAGALIKPKQFFGAARKIENGGSLTIIATALVDTGSLMDTVIFEEFKGTGNSELVLDRRLSNRRVFPAVDPAASGTRKDEQLIKNDDELRRLWALKKFLADRNAADSVEFLKSKLKNYKTNVEFLLSIDPERMSTW